MKAAVATGLDIRPHPNRRFGWAELVLRGVTATTEARFRLRRLDGEPSELGLQGWQNGPSDLIASAVRVEAGDLVLEVGPAVVDYLVEDTQVEVELPAAGVTAFAFWPDIRHSPGRGRPHTLGGRPGLNEVANQYIPEAPQAPCEQATSVAETPIERPRAPRKPPIEDPPPHLIPIVMVTLVLFTAGGIGFWWLETSCMGPGLLTVEGCVPPNREPTQQPPADLTARYELLLERIPPATGAELWAVAEEAAQAGQRDLQFDAAQEARTDGHGPALLQFGRWRDPRYLSRDGWPFPEANPAIAIDYYRRAQDAGMPEGGVELAGLCQHLEERDSALSEKLCPP